MAGEAGEQFEQSETIGPKSAKRPLDALVGSARTSLTLAARKIDGRAALIEALLGLSGGGLTAWGAAQQQAGNPEIGLPMIAFGIVVASLYFWFSVKNRNDGVAASVDSLALAEAAGSHKAIAEAVTGERDRLLRENSELLTAKRGLGESIHAMLAEARLQAGHRESMQLALSRIHTTAAKMIETAGSGTVDDMELCERLKRVLEAAEKLIELAFGVRPDELFTLSVYSRRNNGGGAAVMHRLVAFSSDGQEKHDKRDWPIGEGFVGEAWKSGTELVVPDRTMPQFAGRFHATGDRTKPTDQANYRSVAVMPLRSGAIDESRPELSLIGVVIGTSNRAEQFLSDENDPRAVNAALLRQIAAITALLIAVWRSSDSKEFSTR